jgi:PAS domain S-box-containing protein
MVTKIEASTRLYLLVLVMSVFIIGIGMYGIIEMRAMNRYTQTLYADRVIPMEQLTIVRYDYLVGIIASIEQVQTGQLSYKDAIKNIQEAEKDIAFNWDAYLLTYLTPEEAKIAKLSSGLMSQPAEVITHLKTVLNNEDALALDSIINNEFYPAVNPVVAQMNKLINLQVRVSGEIFKNSTEVYNKSLKQFIALIAISLIFAIPFSYFLVRKVNSLIEDLNASNKKIAMSERKCRAIIEHAGDAIFMLDKDTVITEVNESAGTLLGYPRNELSGMKMTAFLSAGELKKQALFFELVKKNINPLSERRLKRRDGSEVDTEINTRILEEGYISIIRDITDRKKAEEQLKEYKHFFYNSNDLFCIANVRGYTEILNPQFEKILGYSEQEMLTNQFFDFIHPDDIAVTQLEIEKLKSGDSSINFANRYRKKNGDYLWFDWNTTSDPVTGKLYAIGRDITERKRTEEVLRESERKYRTIFENVQDVFYQTNLEGVILEASPSVKSHTGFTREEMIGTKSVNLYYNPDEREKAVNLLRETGEMMDYEVRFKSKSGEPVYISLNAQLISDADGTPVHIDGVFKNITERKRMQEALSEQKEQLELFIEHSPASLAMFDNEMRYIATSRRWMSDYDLGEQQLVGKTHYEVFSEIPAHWKEIHQRCLNGAIEKNEDDSFIRADGRKESLRWEIHPWHRGNGEIGGIIMFTEVITERKRATELFKRQFENSPDFIVIINKAMIIESINHGAPEGATVQELIGQNAIDLLPAESREAAMNVVTTCFETGQNQEIEIAVRYGNWNSVRVVPITYDGNAISHLMIISTNITERRKSAEKIIQSEARLQEAQAIAHIGNWEIDMVHNIHLWSDELFKIFGTSKEETQPSIESFLSFMHADDEGLAKEQINEAFKTLHDAAANFRVIRKDGSMRYVRIEWRFEFDANKQPIRQYGILQDITERKIAEENIRQSEVNYRQMFNLSPAPMWLYEEETHRFLQVNQACISHYGYSKEEFAAMTINDIIPKKDEKDKNNAGKLNLLSGDIIGGGGHLKKSGEIMDVITSSMPVVLNGKKQILLVAIDVTEKNRYEQKLSRAAIKAQEDERYEIGGELHDNVCQILATSLITLGMMKTNLPLKSKSYFNQTHEYISLASQEIRNLSHRLAPTFFEDATLEDVFVGLCSSFNVDNKYDICIDFDDPARRWKISRELQLNLYRILQEQLRNIWKYAKATTIDIVVTINNNILQMKVADNGVGFEVENIKGGGIGLANMNRRARLFSGAFMIDSAVGNGCKIMVVIPLSSAN